MSIHSATRVTFDKVDRGPGWTMKISSLIAIRDLLVLSNKGEFDP